MHRRYWFLLLVLLIEGASLMSVELMGAKLIAPFYGNSLYSILQERKTRKSNFQHPVDAASEINP